MTYFATIWTRLRRDPWMFVLWGAYPLIITYIMYLAFAREGGLNIRVGILLPENLQQSFLADLLHNRRYGPFTLERLPANPPWRQRDDLNRWSAVIELPTLTLADIREHRPITVRLWTNPRERIKPAIIKEALELLLMVLDRGSEYFQPVLEVTLAEQAPTLNEVLAVSQRMYDQFQRYSPTFEALRNIRVEIQNRRAAVMTERDRGRRRYTSIFWLVFLSNIFFFVNALQGWFVRDMEQGMLYRWRGAPRGLLAAYRDALFAQFLLALFMVLAGYSLALAFLHILPAPPGALAVVTVALALISIGLIQIGYLLAPGYKAAQAFVGISGVALFFLGGGLSVILSGMMRNLAPYLPFYIAIKSLNREPGSLALLMLYAIVIFTGGVLIYRRRIARMEV